MTVFIIGNPKAGKDSFGNLLAMHLDGECYSTSSVLISAWEQVFQAEWNPKKKEDHRQELVELGTQVREQHGDGALVKGILKRWEGKPIVVTGIRTIAELWASEKAVKEKTDQNPLIVWVERRMPPIDNTEVSKELAHIIINNDKGISHLPYKAKELAQYITEGM